MTAHDIYQEVTNHIINLLETVEIDEFQAPFITLKDFLIHTNPITGNAYSGINGIILGIQQKKRCYNVNQWGTFKQWCSKGGQVKKGEKGTTLIFYSKVEKKDEQHRKKAESCQEEPAYYYILRQFTVFNIEQVTGYPSNILENDLPINTVTTIKDIEKFIQTSGADIIHDGQTGARAYYAPSYDKITMPNKHLFLENEYGTTTDNYYSVLFHELVHWTGAKHRLNRNYSQDNLTSYQLYALEELVAELGAAFLCSKFNIKQCGRADHAIYLKGWLQALKNDKKFIFKAASKAQRAIDYLNGLVKAPPTSTDISN